MTLTEIVERLDGALIAIGQVQRLALLDAVLAESGYEPFMTAERSAMLKDLSAEVQEYYGECAVALAVTAPKKKAKKDE